MNAEYRVANDLYKLLEADSQKEVIDGIEIKVFRGPLVQTFKSLGVSQVYYSKSIAGLTSLGCITLLRRGARSSPSIVALHHPPHELDWLADRGSGKGLTTSPEGAKLRQEIQDIKRQLGGIDIRAALAEFERRLGELERKMGGN
jgi:hypothetical protein